MSDAAPIPLVAEARRDAARARFLATLEEAKLKLNPATLAHNAVENVKDNVVRNTVETVRARPGAVAAVAGLAALFFARKPLTRLLRPGPKHATAAEPASLNASSNQRETEGSNHE